MLARALVLVAAVAAAALVVAPGGWAVPVRDARVGDAAPRGDRVWVEWWRLHGVDARTGRSFSVEIQTYPVPELRVSLLDIRASRGVAGNDGWVKRKDDAFLDTASLARVANGWRLTATRPRGTADLVVTGRPGVTAGPWRLGDEHVAGSSMPRWERGWMMWSSLVPAGRVQGTVSWDGLRFDISGWTAYLDHTWGRLRDTGGAWNHWDKVVSHPRPGETWVLQGLEPRAGRGAIGPRPNDRLWQGVLVHATGSGVTTCAATVRRSDWSYVSAGATNPRVIVASCGGRSLTFRRASEHYGRTVLSGGRGFAEHRLNFYR